MTKVDSNTIKIEKTDRSNETTSRSRVVLVPTPQTEKEVRKILQPVKLNTETETDKSNMKDIVSGNNEDYKERGCEDAAVDKKYVTRKSQQWKLIVLVLALVCRATKRTKDKYEEDY